ncbi:hypothetical protein [Rheinheimera texasensis]|uniref:hypothetical protein n=1 Tax=Rheinheimera texasensis TaxID=306205 RepID=UPI0032B296A2
MWFIFCLLIATFIHITLTKIYKARPPLLIEGSWIVASINVTYLFGQQNELSAINAAVMWGIFLIIIHIAYWLYAKIKTGAKKLSDNSQKKLHIDNSIYNQIADEMSRGNIYSGLMTRAIAEADGEQNRVQAVYIKIRAEEIAASKESVTHTNEKTHLDTEQITQDSAIQKTSKPSNQTIEKTDVNSSPSQINLQKKSDNGYTDLIYYIIIVIVLFIILTTSS